MKKLMLSVLLGSLSMVAVHAERVDRWAGFRYLIGTWRMDTAEVSNFQRYAFMFNGTFLRMQTRTVIKPSEQKPEGDVHEDLGIFSHDGARDTIVLRSFHSEGFVNLYVLDRVSEDGKTMTFVTESVDNAPAGTRARLTFEMIGPDEFVQKFSVAWPDKDFICYSDQRFKKVE